MSSSMLSSISLLAALLSLTAASSNFGVYNSTVKPIWVPGFKSCNYRDQTFEIGEKFNPSITVNEKLVKNTCSICTCQPTSLVQCTQVICPKLNCSNYIKLPGECCSRCINVTLGDDDHQCVVDNVTYEHGDIFHPVHRNDGSNPYCMSCQCNNGTAQCQDVKSSCPEPVGCSEENQFVPDGHCCKTCRLPNTEKGECFDAFNNIRQKNETWSPELNGIILCSTTCQCKDSKIRAVCLERQCPVPPACKPGEFPRTVNCCPTCSFDNTAPPPALSGSGPTPPPCNGTKYTHKVYLCHDDTGMAIEDTRNNTVQFYNWINAGVKNIQYMTSDEFNNSPCAKKSVGMALQRRVNGLTARESKVKKINNCKIHCAKMVVDMLRPVQNCGMQ
ncbi:PREDICTED: kielin/chordin-like protein [Amphimedon queenslandica]|uniref:VWFC domain-containing protein n=1 Tax=Amphimedon queenslandica TaxID=400682 RepID=A0A1X7VTC6_AMPQE|nr:PREDICTED: kielin/chordin-like protein [Amphimedon queenslandica]|eukprot:XP_019850506.1 PREDICTED: kielin/chordin-like protein [Amphimedon queenslandica]